MLMRAHLSGVPNPFASWNAILCGGRGAEAPLNPSRYHTTAGQGAFPSHVCSYCTIDPGGHLLQLPTTVTTASTYPTTAPNMTITPNDTFIDTCVIQPLYIWLHQHLHNDTHFILSDVILIWENDDQDGGAKVERLQVGFENMVLDLWWPNMVR